MRVTFLKIAGKYVAGFLVDGSERAHPVAFAIGMIAAARALYSAEVFGDEFVWTQTKFGHVGFTVDLMLRQVASTYDAPVIAAYTAPNKVNAFTTGGASDCQSTSNVRGL